MYKAVGRLLAVLSLSLYLSAAIAQSDASSASRETKPYKVMTAGRQVTIRSTKDIKQVMLWTTGGNRLVEQREINNSAFTFTIPVSGKYFFLMLTLTNGKVYTEKIGLQ